MCELCNNFTDKEEYLYHRLFFGKDYLLTFKSEYYKHRTLITQICTALKNSIRLYI